VPEAVDLLVSDDRIESVRTCATRTATADRVKKAHLTIMLRALARLKSGHHRRWCLHLMRWDGADCNFEEILGRYGAAFHPVATRFFYD